MAISDPIRAWLRRLGRLLLIPMAVLLLASPGRPALASGSFTVNSSADANTYDAELTLREALLVANGALTGGLSDGERDQLGGCTFSGSPGNWTITGGCGAGLADTIGFQGDLTIALMGGLPAFTDASTTVRAASGQTVRINAAGLAGVVLDIQAPGTTIENLVLYGASGDTILIHGAADAVHIRDNTIGDDDPAPGGCGQSPDATSGLHIADSLSTTGRAWIYGNLIECIQGSPGHGVFLDISVTDVFVGENDTGQAGSAQHNEITLNAGNGVSLSGAGNNTIRNSTLHDNQGNGVGLSGGYSNLIYGNLIESNTGDGVRLSGFSVSNRIGCPDGVDPNSDAVRNRIRLNGGHGIHLVSEGEVDNEIYCNWIGLGGASGDTAAGNGGNGVYILGSGNAVGDAGFGNVISGNDDQGVRIEGSFGSNNNIYANLIGINAAGTAAIPNGLSGVRISGGANNHVGDMLDPLLGNTISGNIEYGVAVGNAGPDNLIENNRIGLDAAGMTAIPNGDGGVAVFNSDRTRIGTSVIGDSQWIAGNNGPGVIVNGSADVFIGQTNSIGRGPGSAEPIPNRGPGVSLEDANFTSVFAAFIGHNRGPGVVVTGATSSENAIIPFAIHSNEGLPVDLGDDGPTPNDPGDTDSGPNGLLNYPQVTSTSGVFLSGTACANCKVFIYRAVGDPAGGRGGGTYLADVEADASGAWVVALPDGYNRADVTLLACAEPCSFRGDTSELSPRPVAFLPVLQR